MAHYHNKISGLAFIWKFNTIDLNDREKLNVVFDRYIVYIVYIILKSVEDLYWINLKYWIFLLLLLSVQRSQNTSWKVS